MISIGPILCLLTASIFDIFFHIVKVLKIFLKLSGRRTVKLVFYGKYEETKTSGQIPGKAKMMVVEWRKM